MRRVVLEAANEAQVRPACDLLAAHGIAFRVNGAPLSSLRGALPFADAAVTVEVLHDEDVESARSLLAASDQDEAADTVWRCLGCGEESPGSFEVCWKCGRGRVSAASTSPYRGDRPVPEAPAHPASIEEKPSRARWGDLVAALAGCAVVALTELGWTRGGARFADWSQACEAGLLNIVIGVELVIGLALFRPRRAPRGDAAQDKGARWMVDLPTALLLAALLVLARRAIYLSLRNLVGPPTLLPASDDTRPVGEGLDLAVLLFGIAFSASTGALWLYRVLLASARAALRSGASAVVLTSVVATLTWAPRAPVYLPLGASVLVQQALLCGAFLVGDRVWPVAVAAAGSALVPWVIMLGRGG
jgi:hypothetical protein